MDQELQPLSTRSIAILVIIIPVASLLALILTSVLLSGSLWPPEPPTLVATLIGPTVLVGILIYRSNLRDERTVLISDKAARNGFMFTIYVVPLLLVVLSITGSSIEVVLPLLVIWIGAVSSACASAYYYYHRV